MTWSFTAAAERALAEAAAWSSSADDAELHTPELLMGLLAEPECRAARMLQQAGVDVQLVRTRWPNLHSSNHGGRHEFSPAVQAAIEAAIDRLWEYPRPLQIATEHLLLGLVAAAGETADWLADQGLRAAQLEMEIHQLYGHRPGPLAWEPPVDVLGIGGRTENRSAEDINKDLIEGPLRGEPPMAGAETLAAMGPTPGAAQLSPSVPALWRLLDAAANRAREGLRVVEDYVRMVLDDGFLTGELKRLRHELQEALSQLATSDLIAARDTLGDVGATVKTSSEYHRAELVDVAAANWKRLQEALRTLEEYSKVVDVRAAAAIERLRYQSYTLERVADLLRHSLHRLATARLCVLVDGRESEAEFRQLIDSLALAGVGMIQLRDKKLSDALLLGRARTLRDVTRPRGVISIVNDRADIAAAAQVDGVHLGQDDLPISEARAIVGVRAIIGASTHSLEQARQAVLEGANYIGVGPTFPSTTKQFDAFTGVALLQAVAAEIRLPAFAIGGITLANLPDVLAAGFTRAAASGAIVSAADPAGAVAAFMNQFDALTL